MQHQIGKNKYFLQLFDAPILKQVCEPVTKNDKIEDIQEIIREMKRILREHNNGVGLAAPQIGSNKRIILLRPNPKSDIKLDKIEVLVNPELVWRSKQTDFDSEGCLSYPGVSARIERPRRIITTYVPYLDEVNNIAGAGWLGTKDEKYIERSFEGFEARVVSHELEHLIGASRHRDLWIKNNK